MKGITKFFKGQKVLILKREVLIAAGYENNEDPSDFLNLLAGKEITIDEVFEEDQIYTCVEYPGIAIYKVFIQKPIPEASEFTFKEISKMVGINTAENTRRLCKRTCDLLVNTFSSDYGNGELYSGTKNY